MNYTNIEKLKYLKNLATANGRYLEITKDGEYYTADHYDSCDGHLFDDVDEAIAWELGYFGVYDSTHKEIKRIDDLIHKDIELNEGFCTGFIPSTISSDNVLVSMLVNIRRMDDPSAFFSNYFVIDKVYDQDNPLPELGWSNKPIFECDLDANKKAIALGIIDGYYDFSEWEDVLYGIDDDCDLRDALNEIADDGVIAKTACNDKTLHKIGLTDDDLKKVVVRMTADDNEFEVSEFPDHKRKMKM